jgi:hypothetical protein
MRSYVRVHKAAGRPLAVVALAFLASSPAQAEVACYDEAHYPAVMRLEQTAAGLRAVLGGKIAGSKAWPKELPTVRRSTDGGWQRDSPFACEQSGDYCGERPAPETSPVPPVSLSAREALAMRPDMYVGQIEQNVGAWTEHDGAVWFGLRFYEGEGSSGVGGIGRYDRKTGAVVVRRPPVLRDSSIDRVVHDGKSLWIATAMSHECSGDQPAHGLVRYDWGRVKLETFEGRDEGPCGFSVHDLALDAESLWVATDLGLSRWDRRTEKWESFVPDLDDPVLMRPTTCEALYTELLPKLPKEPTDWVIYYYAQLFGELRRFRPRFLEGYVAAMPPSKWTCSELAYLGSRAADYAALMASVLDRRPVDGRDMFCALEAFGEKKTREPEWRDMLLSLLEQEEFPAPIYITTLFEPFAGDAKVGEALAQRLRTKDKPYSEATLLPSMLGDRSVPVLMEALARLQDADRFVLDDILIGLMDATHIGIDPDGKQTKISGRDDYCKVFDCPAKDEDFGRAAAHWLEWWKAHEQEYAAARQ